MRHHEQPQCLPPNGEAVEESLKLLTCLRYLAKIREKLSEINSDFVGFVLFQYFTLCLKTDWALILDSSAVLVWEGSSVNGKIAQGSGSRSSYLPHPLAFPVWDESKGFDQDNVRDNTSRCCCSPAGCYSTPPGTGLTSTFLELQVMSPRQLKGFLKEVSAGSWAEKSSKISIRS